MQDTSKPIWVNKQKEDKTINVKDIIIFVATPVHSDVSIHYTQSLLKLQQYCLLNGIKISFSLMKSSLVTQGRNLCVSAMFEETETKYSHFLFIDSDIEFKVETILKMLSANKDVIATPYPLKSLDWDKIAKRIDTKNLKQGDDMSKNGFTWPVKVEDRGEIRVTDGIAEVTHAPTGCMLIKRNVFEKMMKELPHLKINQPTIINGKQVEREFMYNFFDCYHEPDTKRYYGEDFGFCKRWTEIGGKCHILVDEYITHVGEYRYTGRLMDDLTFSKKN